MKSLSGDQKKKGFILLGFVGVLLLVLFFFVLRPQADPATDAPVTTASVPAGAVPPPPAGAAPVGTKPAAPAPKPASAAAPKAAQVKVVIPVIAAPRKATLAPSRPDPFFPLLHPTAPPVPEPTPVPPPIILPPPPSVDLPSPAPVNAPPSNVLAGLGSPRIARYAPLPGPRWQTGVAPPPSSAAAPRSPNKRLAGVIIGDAMRALLEITKTDAGGAGGAAPGGGLGAEGGGAASTVITRVVQPGDEVDGIKILRINREYENGRQITRMYIREGDEERYIDLRASPTPPQTVTGGGSGSSSSEGGPPRPPGGFGGGGFGGRPGGGFGGIRPVTPGGGITD